MWSQFVTHVCVSLFLCLSQCWMCLIDRSWRRDSTHWKGGSLVPRLSWTSRVTAVSHCCWCSCVTWSQHWRSLLTVRISLNHCATNWTGFILIIHIIRIFICQIHKVRSKITVSKQEQFEHWFTVILILLFSEERKLLLNVYVCSVQMLMGRNEFRWLCPITIYSERRTG